MQCVRCRERAVEGAGVVPDGSILGRELHVVGWTERLDGLVFEQRGLERALDDRDGDVAYLREHFGRLQRAGAAAEVTRRSALEARGLADVEDVAVFSEEPIDTGSVRQRPIAF